MNYYVEKRGANHGLHLVLTVLTCGLWAITGWPIAAIMGRKRTVRGPAQPQYYPQYQQQPPPGPQPPTYPPGPYNPPPGPYGPPPRR
ncbi:hypothetical protein L1085_009610 [Streptomyces sp. MSC1_001]|jgi:hypothetical protein|uniref:hypothetical protein n=1 Tax=Streptomyces sp. MSC1_001 TaxID=2909263 RepID=UPI002030CBF0|nr:hypothetical protein [Streptomyces sp. MSC1_001]